MSRHRGLDKLTEETRARQRNIVFPDTVRNGRLVDAFVWKGSPHPSIVHRIAAWMFGALLMVSGLEFFSEAVKARVEDGFTVGIVIMAAISLSLVLVGIKIFRNGFPRQRSKPELKSSN